VTFTFQKSKTLTTHTVGVSNVINQVTHFVTSQGQEQHKMCVEWDTQNMLVFQHPPGLKQGQKRSTVELFVSLLPGWPTTYPLWCSTATHHHDIIDQAAGLLHLMMSQRKVPRLMSAHLSAQVVYATVENFNTYVTLSRSWGRDTIRLLWDFQWEIITNTCPKNCKKRMNNWKN